VIAEVIFFDPSEAELGRSSVVASAAERAAMYRGELMELLLSVAETARRLGIGKTRFFELLKAEELHAVRLGGRTLIPIAELERFVAQLPPRTRSHSETKKIATRRSLRRPGRSRSRQHVRRLRSRILAAERGKAIKS
jgi:excisionase family DNA binding protein